MAEMKRANGRIPIDLRFFGEDIAEVPEEETPAEEQKPEPKKQEPPPSVNYQELYKTDKALQGYVDAAITKATQTAVVNALQKQKRANDEKLSRVERLQAMSDAEKVKFLEAENQKLQDKYARDKEVESLKSKTAGMLTENKIPTAFLDVFDFEGATAEDIQHRVNMLSEYEFYPKGELEKRVTAGINDKLKQKPPESHPPNTDPDDPFLKGFDGK